MELLNDENGGARTCALCGGPTLEGAAEHGSARVCAERLAALYVMRGERVALLEGYNATKNKQLGELADSKLELERRASKLEADLSRLELELARARRGEAVDGSGAPVDPNVEFPPWMAYMVGLCIFVVGAAVGAAVAIFNYGAGR